MVKQWLSKTFIGLLLLVIAVLVIINQYMSPFEVVINYKQRMGDYWFVMNKESSSVYKYTIRRKEGERTVTFKEALDLLQDEKEDFRKHFITTLKENPFKAYFLETPAVNAFTYDSIDFEFVLVEAKALANIHSDLYTFEKHFRKSICDVTSFFNLGNDAVLIAPCPADLTLDCYAHLAAFVRGSHDFQINEFFKRSAEEMKKRLIIQNDKPIWFSTSGLGVSWLHLRLDSIPKYYTYKPYKMWELGK